MKAGDHPGNPSGSSSPVQNQPTSPHHIYLPMVVSPLPTVTGLIDPTSGGTLSSQNGQVAITFPPGDVSSPTTLTYDQLAAPDESTGPLFNVDDDFQLKATNSSGQAVTQFTQPYQMILTYKDSDWQKLGLANETDMNVYYWIISVIVIFIRIFVT